MEFYWLLPEPSSLIRGRLGTVKKTGEHVCVCVFDYVWRKKRLANNPHLTFSPVAK